MKTNNKVKVNRVLKGIAGMTVKIGGVAIRVVTRVLALLLKAFVWSFRKFPNMWCAILLLFVLNAILMYMSCPALLIKYVINPIFILLLVGGIFKDLFKMLVSLADCITWKK